MHNFSNGVVHFYCTSFFITPKTKVCILKLRLRRAGAGFSALSARVGGGNAAMQYGPLLASRLNLITT